MPEENTQLYKLPPMQPQLTEDDVRSIVASMQRNQQEFSVMQLGAFQSGNFVTGSSGWQLLPNGNFEGNTGTFRGAVTVKSLDIPDTTTANSFHVNSSGDAWWGATTFGAAVGSVSKAGAGIFSNLTVTGGAISGTPISAIPNNSTTDISLLGFTQNLAFTSNSATQVNWTSGTIALSNGRTFSIVSGNTGAMAAATYIYLDTGVSSTVLQTTTTYSTAIGANKILIAVAQNNTVAASVIPFGGGLAVLDGTANIAALSITAAAIAASTITAGKLSVSQLSAIAADLGTITAGSITISGGVASISSAGAAVFKSIQVGGSNTQYTLNDNGIASFGDGSDGAATFDGVGAVTGATLAGSTYTLTRDVYYTSATVSTAVTINPAGYRILGTGILTLNGTATISGNGNAGGAGGNGAQGSGSTGGAGGTAGAAGAALADGYLKGSLAGLIGGVGGAGGNNGVAGSGGGAGTAGSNTLNSLGANGVAGGAGGIGETGNNPGGSGATGAAGGTITASNVKLIANWHLATLLDISSTGSTIKFDNSASSGSAGGGGGGGGNTSVPGGGAGGGGGSGSSGRIVCIYFRSIVVNASASITANGGAGGAGGNGAAALAGGTVGGGGGGGGGGDGGQLILVYNTLTNNGTITANGGVGGAKGLKGTGGGGGGADGVAGTNGTTQSVRQFPLSL